MKGGEGEVPTERPFFACLQELLGGGGNSEVWIKHWSRHTIS
jgi:hypothetical protein